MRARGLRGLAFGLGLAATVLWALAEFGLFDDGRALRGLRNVPVFLGDMWPPDLDPELVRTLAVSLGETMAMAWAGTLLGAAMALPLAVVAARNLAPAPVARGARLVLAAVRTIPSLLWAIFFVVIVGLGPLAGVFGLAAYTLGYLGKVFYEALEAVDPEILDATRATGAGAVAVARHAAVPEAGNALMSQTLFAFEYNVRASSLLGLVGAGGIGFYILSFIQRLQYDRVLTALLMLFALVVLIDGVSRIVRRRFLADRAARSPGWNPLWVRPAREGS